MTFVEDNVLPLGSVSVLVTGGTGKVGQRLVGALLDEGARVSILTRSPPQAGTLWPDAEIDFRVGDLTKGSTLAPVLAGIEVIFHLASYSPAPHEPDIYEAPAHWPVTADGTRNLVEAAAAAGVRRLVYLSSVKAMGDAAAGGDLPADELTPVAPDTLYGRAKLEAERLVLKAGAAHRFHATVLRLPMVYGIVGQGNIVRMIDAVACNRFPPWPRIENRRSAVHLDDAVRAALLAACHSRAEGQVYLVTDGEAYSTRWLYEQIRLGLGQPIPSWTLPLWVLISAAAVGSVFERWVGRAAPLTRTGLAKLTGNAWFTAGKIRRELDFEPEHRLGSEIPRMVTSYLESTDRRT